MEKYVPIVDGVLACDCPYTGEVFVLLMRNALHVPSMEHNLAWPFMMRSGIVINNNVPKIHCEDPIVDEHSVSFDQSDMRILLRLNSVF